MDTRRADAPWENYNWEGGSFCNRSDSSTRRDVSWLPIVARGTSFVGTMQNYPYDNYPYDILTELR